MRKILLSILILSAYSVVGITQTSEGERTVKRIPFITGEDNWYYKVENDEATITGAGSGEMPSELNGYPVRKVASFGDPRTITIANTVTSIENNAFEWCFNLTKISVDPDSTTYSSEGGVLFDKFKTTLIACPARKEGSYIIPSSVTRIEVNAFAHCSSLTSIAIPNSVTRIGDSAFSNCTGLTTLTIPNSVTSIGDKSFYNCTNLASVSIGSGATNIGANAFAHCSSLTSIAIPNSVTSIGEKAFESCANLTSISIGSNVTNIGRNALASCPALTSVTLADGLPEIGASWFMNLPIINIVIPPSVKSISGNAFGFCINLTSITIPNSVTSISSSAFSGCDKLPKETLDQIKQKEPKY